MFEEKGFFLIDDEITRLRLLREGARNRSAATLWTAGKANVLRLRVVEFDIESASFRAELPAELPLERILKLVSSTSGVFFNIELADTHILFQTTLMEFNADDRLLRFRVPEAIYKIQQRKHPRLVIERPSLVRAFHEDPLQPTRSIQRRMIDLSIGGASMRLFFGEERHYRVGQKLNSIQFQLGQRFVHCSGQIQNIRVTQQGKGEPELVMGIIFLEVNESAQKVISAYIDREMVKQFGRMISKQPKDHE